MATGFATRLAPFAPRWNAPFHGGHVPLRRAGLHAVERCLLEQHRPTVPLTPRHFPGHPGLFRPFLRLRRARFHRAVRVRRAACPEQGRLPPTGLSERRASSHPGLAFRPEWRSPNLFTRDPCRGLDGLGDRPRFRAAEPPPSGLACQLLQLVTTRGHSRGIHSALAIGSMVEAKRVSEETVRAGRRHPRMRAFAPQSPEHRTARTPFVTRSARSRDGEHRRDRPARVEVPFSAPPSTKRTPHRETGCLPPSALGHGRSLSAPRHPRFVIPRASVAAPREDPMPFLPLPIRRT